MQLIKKRVKPIRYLNFSFSFEYTKFTYLINEINTYKIFFKILSHSNLRTLLTLSKIQFSTARLILIVETLIFIFVAMHDSLCITPLEEHNRVKTIF